MSAPIDPKIWSDAKEAYIGGTDSLAAIAMRFGISKRAVEKRASDEGWAALRQAQGQHQQPKIIHTPTPTPPRRHQSVGLDKAQIVEDAIFSLSTMLSTSTEDTRGVGGIATGLSRLIELHDKLVPKTAADLADMAINLGISPTDFINALKDKWEKRA